MDKTTREQQILNILQKESFVSVNDLSARLFSSPSNIRRDLTNLERANRVKRVYGGAVLFDNISNIQAFERRIHSESDNKKLLAKKAASLLHNSMSVMLDASSTATYMLEYIKEYKNITLFTNSIYTYEQAIRLGINSHCLGGKPSSDITTLVGAIPEAIVETLHPDILFFSSMCIDDNGDIYDAIEAETRLRKLMIQNCTTSVFLYDSSKVGKSALYKLCNINDVDYSFTNS